MTRVLVVDDEIDTLNLLRIILEISGYEVFTTLNSVDAITLAEVEHPDCVLLDIMMPQLDGFMLCRMMRLHPATLHLPIVFVTAYSALDLEERRLEAGADMVLPKPVGMDMLIETIEKATSLRTTRSAESKLEDALSDIWVRAPSSATDDVKPKPDGSDPVPAFIAEESTPPLNDNTPAPVPAFVTEESTPPPNGNSPAPVTVSPPVQNTPAFLADLDTPKPTPSK